MKTLNNQSTALNQYNEVIIRHLDTLIQPKVKYTSKQLKDILEATYFRILPLKIAKQQRVSVNYLLENLIVKRSNGNHYTKVRMANEASNKTYEVLEGIAQTDIHISKNEVITIDRSTPTIKSITELYFDLLEAYQNGDIRVKTSDYLEALRELSILNNIIPAPQESQITDISFSLGGQE